ncbi:NAD(P)-dependent oxidoreductase [Candidatus Roizmanbacteria bacterium]|nr:NAD(P)-dependent oxidoreductase [Candidatus Roizmanbacteria bacterium]
MILIDTALQKLEEQGKPIRVGMVGAGFMAQGVARQIVNYTKGMRLVAIANRTLDTAKQAYEKAGIPDTVHVASISELDKTIVGQKYAITDDPMILCKSEQIDVTLEMTGNVEFGAEIAITTMENKKHFVSFNAELFATLGSILQVYANKNNVLCTLADGDQPVVQMNLYRFVKGIGVTPVLIGNIKGLHDPYRNPTTQEGFAKKWGQNVSMVTSFADGSKISFEQAVVANATGFGVLKRGMTGPTVEAGTPIDQAPKWYPQDQLLRGAGVVDYVVGASPNPGVFVLGTIDDPMQKHYLNLYKLGEGPLYCFYTPYHLCHFEVPNTIARAAIFHDTALSSLGKPYVEVIATAKKDLKKGEILDGIGRYTTYGLCENASAARAENLLPIGLAEGCRLKRDIQKDTCLTFDDIELPKGRLSDKLWKEQYENFSK